MHTVSSGTGNWSEDRHYTHSPHKTRFGPVPPLFMMRYSVYFENNFSNYLYKICEGNSLCRDKRSTSLEKFELIKIEDREAIHGYRRQYLDSLIEFQELYLELIISEGTFYQIEFDNAACGYCIVNKSRTALVEFHTRFDNLFVNRDILKEICTRLKLASVFCKSFDLPLLNAVMLISNSFKIEGFHFRKCVAGGTPPRKEIVEREATADDAKTLEAINDTFFESNTEIGYYLKNRNLTIFEQPDGRPLGCGLLLQVVRGYPYVDLGMLVNPEFRRGGIGTYIIGRLTTICRSQNKIPICGCAFDNEASYRTLTRAGFIPQYELLLFTL